MNLWTDIRCRLARRFPAGYRPFRYGADVLSEYIQVEPNWCETWVTVPRDRRLWLFRTDVDGYALRRHGPPPFSRRDPYRVEEEFRFNTVTFWAYPVCWVMLPLSALRRWCVRRRARIEAAVVVERWRRRADVSRFGLARFWLKTRGMSERGSFCRPFWS